MEEAAVIRQDVNALLKERAAEMERMLTAEPDETDKKFGEMYALFTVSLLRSRTEDMLRSLKDLTGNVLGALPDQENIKRVTAQNLDVLTAAIAGARARLVAPPEPGRVA